MLVWLHNIDYIEVELTYKQCIDSARVDFHDVCVTVVNTISVQSTTFNSSPSEYGQTVRIIQSAKLTVLFNIGSQWSVS